MENEQGKSRFSTKIKPWIDLVCTIVSILTGLVVIYTFITGNATLKFPDDFWWWCLRFLIWCTLAGLFSYAQLYNAGIHLRSVDLPKADAWLIASVALSLGTALWFHFQFSSIITKFDVWPFPSMRSFITCSVCIECPLIFLGYIRIWYYKPKVHAFLMWFVFGKRVISR